MKHDQRISPDRCPLHGRGRTRCTPAPAPPPDVPSASAGSRSSPRRTSGPNRLQHLHHRLLDEAVEYRRNAERPCAARRFRYLHAPHRLRLVGAFKQMRPDREPVLLQVGRQIIDAHAVDTRSALVALHLRQRLLQILTLDYRFHRRPAGRRAFEAGFRRMGFRSLGQRHSGLHPAPRCPSSA